MLKASLGSRPAAQSRRGQKSEFSQPHSNGTVRIWKADQPPADTWSTVLCGQALPEPFAGRFLKASLSQQLLNTAI